MTDIIEKAARAVADEILSQNPPYPFEETTILTREGVQLHADAIVRAVLQAIREPSIRMQYEGGHVIESGEVGPFGHEVSLVWQAMIDSALGER